MSTVIRKHSESASAAPEMSGAVAARRATAPAKKAAAKRVAVKKVTGRAIASPKPASGAAKVQKSATPPKSKKDKLIRDSFTIPKAEYAVIDELKQRSIGLVRPAKRSELLRAGIKLLASLSDAALLSALGQVPTIKTGRPALKK